MAFGASRLYVDSTYLTMVSADEPMRQDYAKLDEADIASARFSVVWRLPDGVQDVDLATHAAFAGFAETISALPMVTKVVGPSDIALEASRMLAPEMTDAERLADPDLIAEAYIFALTGGSEEVFRYLTPELNLFRTVVFFEYLTNSELFDVIDQSVAPAIEDVAMTVPGMTGSVTGLTVLWAHMDTVILEGQVQTLLILCLVCFILLLVMSRRVGVAAVGTFVNIMPPLAVAAVMSAAGLSLDLASVFVLSLVFGIAIDDTSFLIHRYMNDRKTQPDQAYVAATLHILPAVLTTSILICVGFAVLLSSAFTPIQSFGLFTVLGIILAAVSDVFLLPPLLRFVERNET